MKFKMRFLFAFVALSATLAFVSCKGTGKTGNSPSNPDSPKPDNPKIEAKYKVTFNSNNMECKKGEKGDGGDFASGTEVEAGAYLKFTAKLETGETVEYWHLNGLKKDAETQGTFVYKVAESDANSQKIINVDYKSNALRITFDPAQIKCKKGYGGSGAEVASGMKVKEGEDYQFTALITEDEIVDAWYAGKKKISHSPSREPKGYTVKKEDADEQNVIQIRYEKRAIKTATLKFDESSVGCKKGYIGTGENVSPNTEIKETEDYQFTAKLKTGEKVKHWVINGKAQTSKTKTTFSYTVKKDDINTTTNSITISWEKE